MDNWLVQQAEINIYRNPSLTREIGMKLGINQAAVSKKKQRNNFIW
jgi:hypothetical protein